ncbi:MAG: efflux RND transporter periplasmic adaptor subunit [Acidobacteria bacterium]|nr:efflux RND transporter periplasmic adaptor subunit [Acidobacteriota bacterium]
MSVAKISRLSLFAAGVLLAAACANDRSENRETGGHEHGAAHADSVRLTPEQLVNANLQVVPVRREQPRRTLALTGSIAYDERHTARVAPRIAGRVLRLEVDLGAAVSRGSLLAVLDSPELGEAQAEYLARLAEHRVAHRALERARGLVEQKAISQGEFLEREGMARRAEAALGFAENRLHLLDMSDAEIGRLGAFAEEGLPPHGTVSPELRLRSPIAGTVTAVETSPGQAVERLQTLFVVSDLSRVWAWLDAFEKDLAWVQPGAVVEVEVEALPGVALRGEVDFIGSIEAQTRAARVRARIADPRQRLRPGMFVRARVDVPEQAPAVLLVPLEAVQEIEGRNVVFRQAQAGVFEAVPVGLGRRFDRDVAIASGLAEGDPVVATGAFTLKAEALKGELSHEDH